jgi:hypothetical protein
MGRMEYWTASDWADVTALLYGADNRGVLLQELNLTPAQKLALKNFLEWNELPENRNYRYDYYRDNCSTRVRDAIDRATGGALQEQMGGAPTGTTYRSHTRRLTSGLEPLDLFWFTSFTYVLGHPVDVPLSEWEEAFLPDKLAQHVRHVTLPDASGKARPLVISEQWLATTTRDPMPDGAPTRRLVYALTGLLVGGTFLGLARLARRTSGQNLKSGISDLRSRIVPRVARVGFSLLIIPWALLWGVGACIAAWGWAATDHAASYRNENLLQFSPLILPLAVLGPMVAFGRRRGARVAVALGALGAGLSVLGLLLKVLPGFWQHNGEIIALAVPANLGLAAALVLLARKPVTAPAPQPTLTEAAHKADRASPKKKKSKAKDTVVSE